MQAIFLTTPDLLDEYWEQASIHFEPVVTDAARGEFTVQDIRTLADDKRATIAVVLDGENVILSIAFEFIHYPRISACNIIAMGGSHWNEIAEQFFITFKQWLYGMGVTVIEASCSSVMSRLLRRYGFAKTYEVVRLNL
jgi:hypothetical protein